MYFNVIQSMQRRNKFNTMPDFKSQSFVGPIREREDKTVYIEILGSMFLASVIAGIIQKSTNTFPRQFKNK